MIVCLLWVLHYLRVAGRAVGAGLVADLALQLREHGLDLPRNQRDGQPCLICLHAISLVARCSWHRSPRPTCRLIGPARNRGFVRWPARTLSLFACLSCCVLLVCALCVLFLLLASWHIALQPPGRIALHFF